MQVPSTDFAARDARQAIGLEQAQACSCLLQAYAPFGGVMSGDELVSLLAGRVAQPLSRVAHWIVEDRILHFSARGCTHVPRFQFEDCDLHPLVRRAIGELRGVYDARELAEWFVTPNAWLREDPPARRVLAADPEVVEAARGDRYLASGD